MDSLNYHHLRYFWLVAREGGLKPAAALLKLTLPTLSAQIASLERSLGQKLFRKAGRSLALTEEGLRAFEIAEEIFSLGQELVERISQTKSARQLKLQLGIADSLPKVLTWQVIQPVFALPQAVQLRCQEGPTERLLLELVNARLDVILADEPAPSSLLVKAYSHHLGATGTFFCAVAALARKIQKKFPESLNNAPMMLPFSNTAWRHALESWFKRQNLRPRLVAEFEDAALMKLAASQGLGVIPVPASILPHAREHYGLVPINEATGCTVNYYAITAQRKVQHPAVQAIMPR
jgi:LysR family transcriptional activator of nhaA